MSSFYLLPPYIYLDHQLTANHDQEARRTRRGWKETINTRLAGPNIAMNLAYYTQCSIKGHTVQPVERRIRTLLESRSSASRLPLRVLREKLNINRRTNTKGQKPSLPLHGQLLTAV
jgi:hypothetical protein